MEGSHFRACHDTFISELEFCSSLFFAPLFKPYFVPGKVNRMTLIVNHSDFGIALHGIFAHGAGAALRIELACFFNTENHFFPFRKVQKVSRRGV